MTHISKNSVLEGSQKFATQHRTKDVLTSRKLSCTRAFHRGWGGGSQTTAVSTDVLPLLAIAAPSARGANSPVSRLILPSSCGCPGTVRPAQHAVCFSLSHNIYTSPDDQRNENSTPHYDAILYCLQVTLKTVTQALLILLYRCRLRLQQSSFFFEVCLCFHNDFTSTGCVSQSPCGGQINLIIPLNQDSLHLGVKERKIATK